MWLLVGIVGTLLWMGFIELPHLWKDRRRKDMWVTLVLTLLICAVGMAKALHLLLPNPLDWIAAVIGPFAKAVYACFE
ncbi:hypothetical protein SK3146_04386 [Paenibacillus konkukensis]|uniref:Uncharacterized protein n=1 Tax=Paenibacillus konkukensis TaxID=2020716 RepID=A0ABY4RSJ9_9BACL|nr:hypothetical protein [Paenibacillus konkukensis]UQZ85103.1 hypothetical protein SK3146_04386 [Paenibacillus konkukensis]